MPVNGIELKEGQIWEDNVLIRRTIKRNPSGSVDFPWIGENTEGGGYSTLTNDGRFNGVDYSYYDLNKLIYNPESEEKTAMTNKFNPQPGDKIICNNGEEFICCTLGFLQENIAKFISSDKPILGYWKYKHNNTWQDWDEHGKASYDNDDDYNIREVIPQSVENSTGKKEVALYTVEEVTEAFANALHLVWMGGRKEGIEKVKDYLEKKSNKEYQEYLRLKAIYE